MAVEQQMKVSFIGDTSQLENSFAKVDSGLIGVVKAANDAANALSKIGDQKLPLGNIENYNKAILDLKKNASNISFSVGGKTEGLRETARGMAEVTKQAPKLAKGTADATNALSNLSRVAQDLPFGFIGVANNLNPLLESFQRLKTQSGSTGGALKAMVTGLTGAGGLGLALGVVSAAVTLFSAGFGAWTRGFGGAKDAVDKTKKSVGEFQRTIEETAASIIGPQAAALEKFRAGITDLSLSYDQRLKALQDYNKEAAKSNQISESEINSIEKVNAAINQQIKLLQYRAMIKGGEERLAAQFKVLFEAQFKTQMALDKTNFSLQQFADLSKQATTQTENLASGLTWEQEIRAQKDLGFSFYRIQKGAKAAATEIPPLINFINEMIKKADAFGGAFDGQKITPEKQEFNFFDKFFDVSPKTAQDKAKQAVDMFKTAMEFASQNNRKLSGLEPILFATTQEQAIAEGKKFWDAYQKGLIEERPVIDPLKNIEVKPVGGEFFANINKQIADAVKPTELQKYITSLWTGKQIPLPMRIVPVVKVVPDPITAAVNEAITKALQGIALEGFTAIGDSIGKMLTGGGIGDAFKSFGEFLGSAIQSIGKQMIALAPIMAAIQAAIKSLNPALLLPAGIALTALGGVIKNMFASSLPGHKTGLDYVPFDDYVARLHKGEMVLTAPEAKQYRAMEAPKQRNPFKMFSMPEMPAMQPIVLETRMRGRDFRLGQSREGKSQYRRTGR